MSFRPTTKSTLPPAQTGTNFAYTPYHPPYTGSEAFYYDASPRTAVDFNGGYRYGYAPHTAAPFNNYQRVPQTALEWKNIVLPRYWGVNSFRGLGEYTSTAKAIAGGLGTCLAIGAGVESERMAEGYIHDNF